MNNRTNSDVDTFASRAPTWTKQVLFITDDKEQLAGVDLALQELSCELQVVKSISDALNLHLKQYLAIVLDESVVNQRLSDVLEQFISRAPKAFLIVACDAGSRKAIKNTLATCTAEWILKPISGEEILGQIRRLEQQRRTCDELEDSLRFIRRVADCTPEMLYLFDVEGSYTVYVNRQVCSVLGCAPEGIPAEGFMFFKSVAHPDESDRVAEKLAKKLTKARDGIAVQSEYRIRDRDQRWRWIHSVETVFLRDENGRPKQILGAAQDITDRMALERTEALLAAIVASSHDAIIGKTLEGKIISWNEAAERMYGYTEKEAVDQNISLLVPPELENEVPALLKRIRRGQRIDHYKTTRRNKDNKSFQVLITISPIKNRKGKVTGASTIARRI